MKYETWKNRLDDSQIDFILRDYFTSHPEYNDEKDELFIKYSKVKNEKTNVDMAHRL